MSSTKNESKYMIGLWEMKIIFKSLYLQMGEQIVVTTNVL